LPIIIPTEVKEKFDRSAEFIIELTKAEPKMFGGSMDLCLYLTRLEQLLYLTQKRCKDESEEYQEIAAYNAFVVWKSSIIGLKTYMEIASLPAFPTYVKEGLEAVEAWILSVDSAYKGRSDTSAADK